jgi:GNAT superfamily N-acetyltransferase
VDLLAATVPAAFGADRPKAVQAAKRFTLELATDRAQFEEGFALLDLEFGPRGEMEREEVMSAWFDRGSLSPPDAPIPARYHMVLARDEHGTIAGVRDMFVTTDPSANLSVALLSHSLVLPPFRRTGLASLLRGVPVALAQAALPGAEIMLCAEMEMVRPDNRDSIVRLMAYGHAGFRAIPPAVLGYAQPDFGEWRDDARPIPLLAIVRRIGAETEPTIPRERAWAYVAHYHAAQSCHCDPRQIAGIRANAEQAFAVHPDDPIPLFSLPSHPAERELVRPLLRSVAFRAYPKAWQGTEPLGDPDADLQALALAWSTERIRAKG